MQILIVKIIDPILSLTVREPVMYQLIVDLRITPREHLRIVPCRSHRIRIIVDTGIEQPIVYRVLWEAVMLKLLT